MMFSRPEHEFLREAAKAHADRGMLTALAEVCDMQHVVNLSERHQLDGVVAWRVTEWDLPCPKEVRDWAEARPSYIAQAMVGWAAEAQTASDLLTAAGVKHAFAACPPCYLPYGMPSFPRCTDNMDVLVANGDYGAAINAFLGLAGVQSSATEPWPVDKAERAALAGSAPYRIHLHCSGEVKTLWPAIYGREFRVKLQASTGRWRKSSFASLTCPAALDGLREAEVFGSTLPVASPETEACYLAYDIYSGPWKDGRQSLGGISAICNAVRSQGFDWTRCFAILEDMKARADEAPTAFPPNGVAQSAVHTWWSGRPQQESLLSWTLWGWSLVQDVYGCFPSESIAHALSILGDVPDPSIWLRGSGGWRAHAWDRGWGGTDGVETFIFEWDGMFVGDFPVEAGILRPRVPEIAVPLFIFSGSARLAPLGHGHHALIEQWLSDWQDDLDYPDRACQDWRGGGKDAPG